MEIFSQPGFWSALFAIVLIDLALAGDNALVIGLAVRNIPKNLQSKAIFWGTMGAIIIRALFSLIVVWFLKIPGFMFAGGVALVWIAYKLANDDGSGGHEIEAKDTLRGAVGTIVVADTVMSLENVLAVGGAANGSMVLVVLGLLISIPIIVFGAKVVLSIVEKYPSVIVFGAGILAWTAAKMMLSEPLIKPHLTGITHHFLRDLFYAVIIGLVVIPPLWKRASSQSRLRGLQIAVTVVWLAVFDLLEVAHDWDADPIENWKVWHEGLDLIKFVGWIPLVIWMERFKSAESKKST